MVFLYCKMHFRIHALYAYKNCVQWTAEKYALYHLINFSVHDFWDPQGF